MHKTHSFYWLNMFENKQLTNKKVLVKYKIVADRPEIKN